MYDVSFIRFKDNLTEALNVGNSPISSVIYYDTIQLLPNESYLQITNVEGGISLQSIFTAEIVNYKGEKLKDVSNNIFTEEFLDEDGNTQIAFEIVNIGTDYYNEPVLLKFYDDYVSYWSNPFTVTNEFKELTTFFEYKNYSDFHGISYTNSQKYQAIRLKCYFTNTLNESEIEDYYQISRGATISARVLYKSAESYVFDYLDRFVYDRVNVLLQHEIIYVDGVKLTNKTSFESTDLIDKTNLFEANFSVYKNYKDKKSYEYQVFEGFNTTYLYPFGLYTLPNLGEEIIFQFNTDIQINTGSLSIYTSANDLIVSFDESDMSVYGSNGVIIENLLTYITVNDDYYIVFDAGLISSVNLDVDYNGISDNTTWTFSVVDADFLGTDFNNEDFFTE